MGNIFNEDFQDFIRSLNKHEVKYILVGGFSVIIHGFPRTTGDLDIWVEVTKENYIKLIRAFNEFGLHADDMSEHNFLHKTEFDVFSYGRPPISIEILKSISGVNFNEAWGSAIWHEMKDLKVRVIHLNHLKINKKSSGRYKDLNDLENLS